MSGQIKFKYDIEVANASFGQGIRTTPIQHIQALTAISNNGYLLKPTVLKALGISNTNEIIYQTTPQVVRQVISSETSKLVASSLEHVVSLGTGRSAYIEGYRVGGKTGTAINKIAPFFDLKLKI